MVTSKNIRYSLDDWGNVIKFAVDCNGEIMSGPMVGANGYYEFEDNAH